MTRFSPSSGTASATVAITSILRNEGSSFCACALGVACFEQRLRQLEGDACAAEMLAGIRAIRLVGVEDGERPAAAPWRPRADGDR